MHDNERCVSAKNAGNSAHAPLASAACKRALVKLGGVPFFYYIKAKSPIPATYT
jgi:hypothetical protein